MMLNNAITCFVLGSCVDGPAILWLWVDLHRHCVLHLLALHLGFSVYPSRSRTLRYTVRHTYKQVLPSQCYTLHVYSPQKTASMKQGSRNHITESREWSPSKLHGNHKVKDGNLCPSLIRCNLYSAPWGFSYGQSLVNNGFNAGTLQPKWQAKLTDLKFSHFKRLITANMSCCFCKTLPLNYTDLKMPPLRTHPLVSRNNRPPVLVLPLVHCICKE